jgi:hypothetical protein
MKTILIERDTLEESLLALSVLVCRKSLKHSRVCADNRFILIDTDQNFKQAGDALIVEAVQGL